MESATIFTFYNELRWDFLPILCEIIDDRIHFGISYKMAVRNFIRVFRKKYLSRKAFGARFTTRFDFHLILKY